LTRERIIPLHEYDDICRVCCPVVAPDDLTKSSTPRQRRALVRVLIPKRMQPYLRGLRKRVERRRAKNLVEPFRTIYPYTQVNHTRQRKLIRLAETIERENVPGACVECGVLDGGAGRARDAAVGSRDSPVRRVGRHARRNT
jgi:hypothetical protein